MRIAIALILFFSQAAFAADVSTVNGVSDAAISTVMGVSGAGISTLAGCNYDDGDAACTKWDEMTSTDSYDNGFYIGQFGYNPASNRNVCQIDVNFQANPNDSVKVGIYNITNTTDIGAAVCSQTQTVNAIGWVSFQITGDCNISNGTNYIIAVNVVDFSPYIYMYASTSKSLDSGGEAIWGTDGTRSGYWSTYDVGFALYYK